MSWNVNGLRAVLAKGQLAKLLKTAKPDILGLQEIKISEAKLEALKLVFPGYTLLTNGARREGYSGTAVLIKKTWLKQNPLLNISNLTLDKFDAEGRLQVLQFKKFYFLNAYFPNSNHELSRLDYKQEFNLEILAFLKKLDKKSPLIITGDFNVAHEAIDLARPKENEGSAGFTLEEREDFTKFIKAGFIDSFRFQNPKQIQYTWWSFRAGARRRNIGWRIDYFLVSDRLKNMIKQAEIFDKFLGSDHAPIEIDLSFPQG